MEIPVIDGLCDVLELNGLRWSSPLKAVSSGNSKHRAKSGHLLNFRARPSTSFIDTSLLTAFEDMRFIWSQTPSTLGYVGVVFFRFRFQQLQKIIFSGCPFSQLIPAVDVDVRTSCNLSSTELLRCGCVVRVCRVHVGEMMDMKSINYSWWL